VRPGRPASGYAGIVPVQLDLSRAACLSPRPIFLWTALVLLASPSLQAQAQQAPAPVTPDANQQAAPAPQPPPPPAPPRFLVVLDAAHGGDDTGGGFDKKTEKEITLALSVRLRSLLAARGITVLTTRESDTTVSLDRRAEIADRFNAQACVSLHATQAGSGVHLFVSSLAPTQPTRLPAWKTAQSGSVSRSIALAGILNSTLQHSGFPVTIGRTGLPAIESMTCPAVAIELAPDRSQQPPTPVDDPAYQAHVTEAIAAALLEWETEGRQP
jgi:N-acetylmuramoyl-L-alanine amidase